MIMYATPCFVTSFIDPFYQVDVQGLLDKSKLTFDLDKNWLQAQYGPQWICCLNNGCSQNGRVNDGGRISYRAYKGSPTTMNKYT